MTSATFPSVHARANANATARVSAALHGPTAAAAADDEPVPTVAEASPEANRTVITNGLRPTRVHRLGNNTIAIARVAFESALQVKAELFDLGIQLPLSHKMSKRPRRLDDVHERRHGVVVTDDDGVCLRRLGSPV